MADERILENLGDAASSFEGIFPDEFASGLKTSGVTGPELKPEPGVKASGKHRGANETFGATCPSCGGSLRISEGVKSLRCEYCGSSLYVSNPPGIRSFYVKPGISEGKVKLEALRYISDRTDSRIKGKHTSVVDLKLIHVPFWKMKGRFLGWVCGEEIELLKTEKSVPTPNGDYKTTSVEQVVHPFSKFVTRHVDWSAPACFLRYLGLQGIALKASLLEWEVFDHDLRDTMNIALPMTSESKARADCLKHTVNLAKPSGARIHAGRFKLFGSSLSLYYYPVYILRYKFKNRVYAITLDGSNGKVIRADLPGLKKINPAPFFYVPAALAFLAGIYFPLVFIAAGAVYAADQVKSSSFLMPHIWLKYRLKKWFGGTKP